MTDAPDILDHIAKLFSLPVGEVGEGAFRHTLHEAAREILRLRTPALYRMGNHYVASPDAAAIPGKGGEKFTLRMFADLGESEWEVVAGKSGNTARRITP
jgi:hypothetical protein